MMVGRLEAGREMMGAGGVGREAPSLCSRFQSERHQRVGLWPTGMELRAGDVVALEHRAYAPRAKALLADMTTPTSGHPVPTYSIPLPSMP